MENLFFLFVNMTHCYCYSVCIEFERLLQEQAPLEAYTEWIETIVDRCILQPTQMGRMSLRKAIRKFLLTWATFGSRVLREVHVSSAFGKSIIKQEYVNILH